MPASRPQMMNWFTPNTPQRRHRRDRDDEAGQQLNADEAGDLRVDLVEDLDGQLFLPQRRSGDLHDLSLVEITGDEEEVDEKEDHRELAGGGEQVHAAPVQVAPSRRTRARRSAPSARSDRDRGCPPAVPIAATATSAVFCTSVAAFCTSPSAPGARSLRTRSRIRCAASGTCRTICSACPLRL